jgi:transposase
MATIKTRKQRPRTTKKERLNAQGMPVIQPDAAGIDVGATVLCAAVSPDRDAQPVRTFGTFTEDLQALAAWLRACAVRTVAIEATGVYWVPVVQVLAAADLEVCLTNPRHLQNVRGRKTDVCDAQWLQQLHAVGLLKASFRPGDDICALRTLYRQREHLVRQAAEQIQLMQKSLTQMNLHLHHVLSDLAGVSGLRIVDAILAGERDPRTLAKLRHERVQAEEQTIVAALTGDWRPEHLFTLRQARQTFQHYQQMLRACDAEIEVWLKRHPRGPGTGGRQSLVAGVAKQKKKKLSRNEPVLPTLELRSELAARFGVDLVAVPGLGVTSVYGLYAELGEDLKAFANVKQFTSWLGLCPDPRKSGGKVLSSHTRDVQHRVARIFRQAAETMVRSDCHLGRFYRRIRAKLGGPQAVTATAHKLARIFYHLVTSQQPYDESVFQREDDRYHARRLQALHRQAKALGFTLEPTPQVS